MGQMCSDITLLLMVDNKNEVDVGLPTTKHSATIRRLFLVRERPNLPDHDYAYTDAKINPEGFFVGKFRTTRSQSAFPL